MRINPIFVEYLKLIQSCYRFEFWEGENNEPYMLLIWEYEFEGKKRKMTLRYDKSKLEIMNTEGEMGFARMLLRDFEELRRVVYGPHYVESDSLKGLTI